MLLLQAQTVDPCTNYDCRFDFQGIHVLTTGAVSGCKLHKLKSELKDIVKFSKNAMSLTYAGKFKIIIGFQVKQQQPKI